MAIRRVLAPEDGNLSSSIVKSTKKINYTDIDLSFEMKPSGDIYKKVDAAAVKQAVKNLITTNYYEKPFDPFFGGNVSSMLFDLLDDYTSMDVKDNLIEAIEFYEPRAKILEVNVDLRDDNNSIEITILFKIVNTEEVVSVTTTLSRLR